MTVYVMRFEDEVNECLRRGMAAYEIMTEGLVAGMDIVGVDFRDGVLFVPEVLMSAKAMKGGMEILRPLLINSGAPQLGKAVIGTVKGDIHDIGKNLVAMMWEGAGIEVIDLGINCDVDKFFNALNQHNPDILGMSALLTTTMPYMKVVIDSMKERNIRDKYMVFVGGAPLNDAFAEEIEADVYCRDAAIAVDLAKKHLSIRRSKA
jgi:5-methyltetrahydrofolate--homocysteine methyltransferase